jgi:hypothetical protein
MPSFGPNVRTNCADSAAAGPPGRQASEQSSAVLSRAVHSGAAWATQDLGKVLHCTALLSTALPTALLSGAACNPGPDTEHLSLKFRLQHARPLYT